MKNEECGWSDPPQVWLLTGHKAGDNTQVLALAEALGWPFEIKRLVYKKSELITNLLLGCTLAGIIKRRSSPLTPPWPDLIITAGRRNEPVARWIQQQADNKPRLVHIGRPWARLEHFDLIVTTPQYQLPGRANILHTTMPLHRVTEGRLAEAAAEWSPRLAHLPRPHIAVLVGGHSGPVTFDPEKAARLGHQVSAMASAAGGSLLVSTSARTPKSSVDALERSLTVPRHFFRWVPNSRDNPYFGYLALADSFIVTSESISMLTEACFTRRPVHIFDMSDAPRLTPPLSMLDRRYLRWLWPRFRFKALIHTLAMRLGPRRMMRDVGLMHELLIQSGRAVWLGQHFSSRPLSPPLEDVEQAVARVRALFLS
jgi:mitochondrial fission protein ELM1